jgi:hypothetical protein
MKMTDYFQVERLLKHPFKSALIIYIIYLLIAIFSYFNIVGFPPSTNWIEIKWICIWSFAYFLSFYILVSIYKDISFMHDEQIKGRYNYIYKNNLIEELFYQSFISKIPITLGFLVSFVYLFFGRIMFGTVVPYLDDSIVIFLIAIVLCIFIYVTYYMSKLGNVMLQNFEKYDNPANVTNLFNITKRNEILSFGTLISKSIFILSIISAMLILFAVLDVYRYSYKFIGYLLLAAMVILPPLVFYALIMNFHKTLSKAKEKSLEYLNIEIGRIYKKIIENENISPSEKQRFKMLQELQKDIYSIQVWPINVKISYNLILSSILPIVVSTVKEIGYFKNLLF